ncbi:hypothetical protein ACWC98_12145 [Streptomyces goshikiensis]
MELDRSRLLRDKLTQGAESSAALRPLRAVEMVRAVFDAVSVSLLLRAASAAEATAADVGGAQPEGGPAGLWEDHLRALFPDGFRGWTSTAWTWSPWTPMSSASYRGS